MATWPLSHSMSLLIWTLLQYIVVSSGSGFLNVLATAYTHHVFHVVTICCLFGPQFAPERLVNFPFYCVSSAISLIFLFNNTLSSNSKMPKYAGRHTFLKFIQKRLYPTHSSYKNLSCVLYKLQQVTHHCYRNPQIPDKVHYVNISICMCMNLTSIFSCSPVRGTSF